MLQRNDLKESRIGELVTGEANPIPTKLTRDQIKERYRPVDEETKSLVHGICSRFGYLPECAKHSSQYVLSVDFADALEDLARLLSSDEGPVLQQLGEMQVVERHLIPMLFVMKKGRFETSLGLLLELLNLLMEPNLSANRTASPLLLDYQRQSKRNFECKQVWERVLQLFASCLTAKMTAQDEGLLRKLLIFTRNILAIPDGTSNSSWGMTSPILGRQERVIMAMYECRLVEFLIAAATSCNDTREGRPFISQGALLLEIFHHFLCHADPLLVHQATNRHSNCDTPQRNSSEELLRDEHRPMGRHKSLRHGRFTGSFVVKLSTGEDLILAKSRLVDEFEALDKGRRIQHQAKKFTIDDFGNNASTARCSELQVIGQIARAFIMEGAFRELITNCQEREFPSDLPNLFQLRLCAWVLRYWRGSNLMIPGLQLTHLDQDAIEIVLREDFLGREGHTLCRFFDERQYPLIMASLLFFREVFRIFDYSVQSLQTIDQTWVKDTLGGFFYRSEVVTIFGNILNNSHRLSIKALSVLVEVNHLLLKILKRFIVIKGHFYVGTSRHHRKKARQTPNNYEEMDEDSDEGGEEEKRSEQEFHWESFLARYTTEGVIAALVRLLRVAPQQEASINRFVAILLNRLASDLKVPSILFRASLLEAINNILVHSYHEPQWRQQNEPLLKFCEYLTRKFISALQKNHLLAIEIFFSSQLSSQDMVERMKLGQDQTDGALKERIEAPLPEHWTLEEKISWLVRLLVDSEQSTAISWLCGKIYDAAASYKLRNYSEKSREKQGSNDEGPSMDDQISGTINKEVQNLEMGQIAISSTLPQDYYLHAQTNTIQAAVDDSVFATLLKLCGAVKRDKSWILPSGVLFENLLKCASTIQSCLRLAIDEQQDQDGEEREDEYDLGEHYDDGNGNGDGDDTLKKSKSKRPRHQPIKTKSREEIPTTLFSDATTNTANNDFEPIPFSINPIASRWARMKKENFFLATINVTMNDAEGAGPSENVSNDLIRGNNDKELEMIRRPKRAPLAIYSEDEDY